jgi:hypothetical protein
MNYLRWAAFHAPWPNSPAPPQPTYHTVTSTGIWSHPVSLTSRALRKQPPTRGPPGSVTTAPTSSLSRGPILSTASCHRLTGPTRRILPRPPATKRDFLAGTLTPTAVAPTNSDSPFPIKFIARRCFCPLDSITRAPPRSSSEAGLREKERDREDPILPPRSYLTTIVARCPPFWRGDSPRYTDRDQGRLGVRRTARDQLISRRSKCLTAMPLSIAASNACRCWTTVSSPLSFARIPASWKCRH